MIKSYVSYFSYTIGNCYTCQSITIIESAIAYTCQTIRKCYINQRYVKKVNGESFAVDKNGNLIKDENWFSYYEGIKMQQRLALKYDLDYLPINKEEYLYFYCNIDELNINVENEVLSSKVRLERNYYANLINDYGNKSQYSSWVDSDNHNIFQRPDYIKEA